jgi:hypothetical protein
MTHSPPARPAPQNAAQLAGGAKTANPNYVQVINNNTVNARLVVHRKRADYLVKCGRAEPIGADQIRLITHEDNAKLQIDAADGYDSTPGYFELAPSVSDGYTVVQGTRGRGPSELSPVARHLDGWRQQTKKAKTGRSATVRQTWTQTQSKAEYADRLKEVQTIAKS